MEILNELFLNKMKDVANLFSAKKTGAVNKHYTLNAIRQILAEYSGRHISITECLSKAGSMTADLIFTHYAEAKTDKNKSTYDTILIMATNYFAMLHMDMYTGFYAVNKTHTVNQVAALVENVLRETADNRGLKTHTFDEAIRESLDFTEQMVDVYYRAGTEGCHRFISSAIYSLLLFKNRNLSVKREQIEEAVRTIQAEKYLAANYKNFSNPAMRR